MINGITLPSGRIGWRARLREVYGSAEDLAAWDGCYGLLERLKFASPEEAWEADPIIQGGVDPADYSVAGVDPKATALAAPLLRETLRRVRDGLTTIDSAVPMHPATSGIMQLLRLAVDVADGVEDQAKLAALFEE